MQGRRIYTDEQGGYFADKDHATCLGAFSDLRPGDYWHAGKYWFAQVPTGSYANLSGHKITEHEDGTITVSPSILLTCPGSEGQNWHGFLEHGVWRTV